MEISNIVLSIMLASVCLLTAELIYFKRKQISKIMVKQLSQIADQFDCSIDEFEIGKDIIVGMDKTKIMMFVVKRRINEFESYHINLSESKGCRVLGHGTKTVKKNKEEKQIERLDLEFESKDPCVKKQTINFYDFDETTSLNGELELIRKWGKIAKEAIKNLKNNSTINLILNESIH